MTSVAYAAASAGGGAAGGIASFLPLILIFVVFYFLLIRPQQKQAKQHQAFLGDLKKGNKVITKGGIYGEITSISDAVLTLEIAENIQIKVDRSSIAGPQVKDDPKAAKAGKDKKIKSSGS